MRTRTAPLEIRFKVHPSCPANGLYTAGWAWPVPAVFRSCLGQQWAARGRHGNKAYGWIDTGIYAFHRGCTLYSSPDAYTTAPELLTDPGTMMVQVEEAYPCTRDHDGFLSYRWYELDEKRVFRPLMSNTPNCTQTEFVHRLKERLDPLLPIDDPGLPNAEPMPDPVPGGFLIAYRDSYGFVSERVISNIASVDSTKIRAFCHLRSEPRTFILKSIESAFSCDTGESIAPERLADAAQARKER